MNSGQRTESPILTGARRGEGNAATGHIVYIITDLELGGVPLHLTRLARAMRDRGFHATIVSLAPAGPVGELLESEGFEIRSCRAQGAWDVRVLPRLAELLRTVKPDVVHAMLFHANIAARWAASRIGLARERLLCEIQTVEIERRWHLWVDRFTYEGCRCTIGNSPSVIEHLHRRAGIPYEHLRLVRGGIDPTVFEGTAPFDKASLGVDPDEPIIFWAGRLDPVKGLMLLMEAFAQLARTHRAHLMLAGEGPLRDALLHRASELALTDRLHLLGSRNDIPRWLKTCDVFAFPSRTEGLPNALLEAMAAGCPIVATDVPGCRDLIRHGETGLLVPYGDPHALAQALGALCTDTTLARSLGRRATRIAAREWHISRTFDAYAALYREVLAEGSA